MSHGSLSFSPSLLPSFHQAFQKELEAHGQSVDAAKAAGSNLVSDMLDDPTVTQRDLSELEAMWSDICRLCGSKQERLEAALEVCACWPACKQAGGYVCDDTYLMCPHCLLFRQDFVA